MYSSSQPENPIRQPFCKYLLQNYRRFCQHTTSIQGLKYAVDRERSVWERFYYITAFVIVVGVAFHFAGNVYINWTHTPVIISMKPTTTSVEDIPFPAISICNMNRVKLSKVAKFAKGSLDYAMLQMACFQEMNFSSYKHLRNENTTDNFDDFIIRNAQPCHEMIEYCTFGAQALDCSTLFKEMLLDEGLCCVFNVLHPAFLFKGEFKFIRDYTTTKGRIPVDWGPEKGYAANLPKIFYPRRGLGAGVSQGFNVVLNANIDDYYCSSTNGAGFKVILHNPIDTPYIRETGLLAKIGYQSRFSISSLSFEATPALRDIDPKHRYCVFDDEAELIYFHYYTRRNCEMECESKLYYQFCHCIPYYMPLIYANASQCEVEDFDCMIAVHNNRDHHENNACKEECLPSCFQLSYSALIFDTPLAVQNYGLYNVYLRNISKDYMQKNLAFVQFHYPAPYFRSNQKAPYTAFTDFLSQTGGIMSLMMGFGVVSIFELLYFAFLCPIIDFFLKRPLSGFGGKREAPEMPPIYKEKASDVTSEKCVQHELDNYNNCSKEGIATIILRSDLNSKNRNIGCLRCTKKFKSHLSVYNYLE